MKLVLQRSLVALLVLLARCTGDDGNTECNLGALDCACNQGQCLGGLVCTGDLCVSGGAENSDSTVTSTTDSSTDTSTDVSSTPTDTSSSETGEPCDPPNILCDAECINPLSDPGNCGECGKACDTVLDSGGCIQGSCRPVWSGCIDASSLTLCSEICQAGGFAGCSTAACGDDNMSIWWFGAESTCEAGTFSPEAEANACETEPNGMNSFFYRCCCDQN